MQGAVHKRHRIFLAVLIPPLPHVGILTLIYLLNFYLLISCKIGIADLPSPYNIPTSFMDGPQGQKWNTNMDRNHFWSIILTFRQIPQDAFLPSQIYLPNVVDPELKKCYFIYIHKQVCSKVPIILFFVRPKRTSGNCYVSFFLTEKTPLNLPKYRSKCTVIHRLLKLVYG